MDELNFDDLTPQSIPVRYGGKRYLLREANGDAACKYRNYLLKATKLGPDGKPASYENLADVEPLLVALCLLEQLPGGGEQPVSAATVRSWPARVQKVLFTKVKAMSELGESDTPEALQAQIAEAQAKLAALEEHGVPAKNGRAPTPAGSPSPASSASA